MDDQKQRADAGKLDLSISPMEWAMMAADLTEAGAYKYSRDGWRKNPMEDRRIIGPLLRHVAKAQAGAVYDDETGCLHWAQVAWNANVLGMMAMYKKLGCPLGNQPHYDELVGALYNTHFREKFFEKYKPDVVVEENPLRAVADPE